MRGIKCNVNLSLDAISIFFVNDLFDGSGDEDVALFVQQVFAFVALSTCKAIDGSMFVTVIFQSLKLNIKIKLVLLLSNKV